MNRVLIAALVTPSLLIAPPAQAQQVLPLATDEPIAGALLGSDVDSYRVSVGDRFFVYGEVDQQTVDAVITIYAPNGDRVGTFDTSGEGPEPFGFESEVEGAHRIEVSSFGEEAGEYELVLTRLDPIAKNPEDRIDQIAAPYDGNDRPGMVVGLVEDGSLSIVRSYGMANLEWHIPNGTDVAYNIGSTSKQFTAFAIALLEAQGRLSLDANVRDYLPELPPFDEVVTVRHLLTHTSGYRDMMDLLLMGDREPEDQFDQSEVIPTLLRQLKLQDSPGFTYRYNNTGYMLLALVVERVTGQSFAAWVDENVFEPAGMHDTDIRWSRGHVIERAAEGYIPGPGGFRRGIQNSASYGPSNVYSTIPDLAKWMANLASGTVGGRDLITSMTTPNILENGDPTVYGLGLRIDTHRGLPRIQHSGGAMAFRSWFAYYPTLNAGVIILSNSSAFDRGVVEATTEAFLGEHLEPVPASTPSATSDEDGSAAPRVAEARLDEYEGAYFSAELETFYDVIFTRGSLAVDHRRLGVLPLEVEGPDQFNAAYPFTAVEFDRDSRGGVCGFSVSSPRNSDVEFVRVGPVGTRVVGSPSR